MQHHIWAKFSVDRPKLNDQGGVLNWISPSAIHFHIVVGTSHFGEKMGIIIFRGNGVYLMTLRKQRFNKIEPEIVDVPGGIEYNGDFHRGLRSGTEFSMVSRKTRYYEFFITSIQQS